MPTTWESFIVRTTLAVGLSLVPNALRAQARCAHEQLETHAAHYCLYGDAGPTIILAAGAGLNVHTWDDLAPGVAEFGTVLTFDRAGLGLSSDAPGGLRTPRQIATELRELVAALELPSPYILVGHSAGGWHMLRLAEQLPAEVTGVLLVDTPPPTFERRRNDLLNEDERRARREALARGAASAPEVVQRERVGARLGVHSGFAPLPDHTSLVVVAADRQNFGSGPHEQAHQELWVDLSREWLDLSDTGRFIVAYGSGHMVHRERPQLVIELIRGLAAPLSW